MSHGSKPINGNIHRSRIAFNINLSDALVQSVRNMECPFTRRELFCFQALYNIFDKTIITNTIILRHYQPFIKYVLNKKREKRERKREIGRELGGFRIIMKNKMM